MHCPACGVEAVEQAVYCHKCGERLRPAGDEAPENSRQAGDSATDPAGSSTPTRRDAQDQPEEELWRGGYSSKAMTGAWITSGLVSLLLLAGGILWARDGPLVADSGGGDDPAVGSTPSPSCATAA